MITKLICPNCSETKVFYANQVCHSSILIDEHKNWIENEEIYDAGNPFGPFTCKRCGTEAKEMATDFTENIS